MTYNHEEIIDALIVIRTTCEDFDDCESCPFWKDEKCYINFNPVDWTLNENNENWKAFL